MLTKGTHDRQICKWRWHIKPQNIVIKYMTFNLFKLYLNKLWGYGMEK